MHSMNPQKSALTSLDDVFYTSDLESASVPMQARDLGSFVDRSFRQALPWQYIRELIMNSFEANPGEIIVEPDWIYVENRVGQGFDPVYRWSIWDTGHGMSKKDLTLFYGNIFSSSKGTMRGEHVNFGMGAKIAAAPLSPAGVIVMSWQNGVGNMMIIHKNKTTGQYSIAKQAFENDFGQIIYEEVGPAPEEYDFYYDTKGNKKKRVNGTLVILMGQSPTDNTYAGFTLPDNVVWDQKWTIRINSLYLNHRFADLQKKCKVSVYGVTKDNMAHWAKSRAEASKTGKNGRFGQYRIPQGAFPFWIDSASNHGQVRLTDGVMHWFLFEPVDFHAMKEKDGYRLERGLSRVKKNKAMIPGTNTYDPLVRLQSRNSYTPTAGYTGVLYKGELYNLDGKGNKHLFNFCGVYKSAVQQRLVLIMEPDYTESSGVFPNAVRSHLEYKGEKDGKLPWSRWGSEFMQKMPQPIRESLARASTTVEASYEAIAKKVRKESQNRLAEFDLTFRSGGGGRLRRPSKARWACPNDDCDTETFMAFHVPGSTPPCPSCRTLSIRWVNPNPRTLPLTWACNTCGHEFREFRPMKGQNPPCPECDSKDVERKKRSRNNGNLGNQNKRTAPDIHIKLIDDDGASVPAQWNADSLELLVFASYKVYRDHVRHWTEIYSHLEAIEKTVDMVTMEVYSNMLYHRVSHILALRSDSGFTSGDLEKMLSGPAFITAVAGFYEADMLIKQKLTGRLSRASA